MPMLRYTQAYYTCKRGRHMKLKALVGSGDKIALFTLPFLLLGAILTILMPSFFSVGDPPIVLTVISLLHVTCWGDHVDLVSHVDRHKRPAKKTDHNRTVRYREAPIIYRCGFPCAAMDWFALEHLVRSCDWNHPLHWIETICA
jgi:hypothetical protein